MRRAFADTFYFLALLNAADTFHEVAAEFSAAFSGVMVTTDLVLIELGDGMAGLRSRRTVIEFIELLRRNASVRIAPIRQGCLPAVGTSIAAGPTKSGRGLIAFRLW